ncbi:hypothetical protein M0Q97_11680 [Candidatus Dojkabacteria bacterium]|jgi:hypothetical protein|nr:hypothetical protein [Candidatus Dojkabacteria bacterium]
MMKNIVINEIKEFLAERNFNVKITEQIRCETLFTKQINENDNVEKRNDIIYLIKNNQWEKQNPNSFYESLKKSKHSMMLTDYTPSELSKMKLFKLKGHNIGFALKKIKDGKYSEIVSVHNNEPDVKNIGNELLNAAINNGGCYLDHFDGFLSNLYSNLGFVEYKRDSYDPKYDPDNEFKTKYGASDIIYRVHRNCM